MRRSNLWISLCSRCLWPNPRAVCSHGGRSSLVLCPGIEPGLLDEGEKGGHSMVSPNCWLPQSSWIGSVTSECCFMSVWTCLAAALPSAGPAFTFSPSARGFPELSFCFRSYPWPVGNPELGRDGEVKMKPKVGHHAVGLILLSIFRLLSRT